MRNELSWRFPSTEPGIGPGMEHGGIVWRKPVEGFVVEPRGFGVEPYEYICSKPCVMKEGDTYVLWVNTFGTAYRVHRLTSADGITWDWSPRVGPAGEMGTGAARAFDDHQRSYPTMVREGDELRAWFTGNGFGRKGIGYAVGKVGG